MWTTDHLARLTLYAVASTEFSDRFDASNPENLPLHLGWATQDYPQNSCAGSDSGCGSIPAPIFTFGTVPKDSSKIAGLLQAPTLPLTRASCTRMTQTNTLSATGFPSPSQCSGDKMYIEKYDSNAARIDKFNSLIPKMVWRDQIGDIFPSTKVLEAGVELIFSARTWAMSRE